MCRVSIQQDTCGTLMLTMPVNGMVMGTASYGYAFMTLSDRKKPGLQTHISTALECTGEVVFWGHFIQYVWLGAAGVTENVLTLQSVHTEACSSEKEPVLHGMQVAMLEAPRTGDAVPAGHFWHVWAPVDVTDEKVPVGHCCALNNVSTVCEIPENWMTEPDCLM